MVRIAGPVAAVLFIGYATPNANLNFWKQYKTGSAVLLQENLGVGAEGLSTHESKDQMIAAFSSLSLHPVQGIVELPQLVIWPEAPTSFVDSDPDLRNSISMLARQMQAAVIVNDVSFASRNSSGRYDLYNSASFFLPDGSYAGRYDKMHLVPFGEYTPYKPLFFFVGHLLDDLPFIPGTNRTVLQSRGKSFGIFICYESIFGDEIRHFALNGAQVLVNISDDGWYGDTSAPWEHLDMVRMRAIENQRWLLRSTNTGVTGAINPIGQMTEQLPRHVRGSLAVMFGYENDLTFYTRHGDWLAWLCALVSVSALGWGLARGRFMKAAEVH
jgi:apolipoprotein N-acyltransferase